MPTRDGSGTTNSPPLALGQKAGEHDDGLSSFAGVRPRLFGIAYRMLGRASEAEDEESAELTRVMESLQTLP